MVGHISFTEKTICNICEYYIVCLIICHWTLHPMYYLWYYYSSFCSGRTTVTLATLPMCQGSSSLLGWRQLCQWCLQPSQVIFHLYVMFKIFHNTMQSISNIAEIKSGNIHSHVFLLQSSGKSVQGLPLVGRKTFWVGDSDGALSHWAWFPGICHSLSRGKLELGQILCIHCIYCASRKVNKV